MAKDMNPKMDALTFDMLCRIAQAASDIERGAPKPRYIAQDITDMVYNALCGETIMEPNHEPFPSWVKNFSHVVRQDDGGKQS